MSKQSPHPESPKSVESTSTRRNKDKNSTGDLMDHDHLPSTQNTSHKTSSSSSGSRRSTSHRANTEYTVGWICALPIEMAAAKSMMDEIHGDPQTLPQRADENTYLLGGIAGFGVVVACLPKDEIGVNSAAPVARDMLHTFPNIRVGLLVGIGAGIPNYDGDKIRDIRLGDVVVSSDKGTGGVVLYDFGTRAGDGTFQHAYALNRPPRSLRTAMSRIEMEHQTCKPKIRQYIERALDWYPHMRTAGYAYPEKSADRFFNTDSVHVPGPSCAQCSTSNLVKRWERPPRDPEIHYGVIATGNAVNKHAPTRTDIGRRHGAICLEMEAAGLMNHFPCVVVRGICDYADAHKNDEWQRYAAMTAAAYTKELLEHIQPRDVEGERKLIGNLHSGRSLVLPSPISRLWKSARKY